MPLPSKMSFRSSLLLVSIGVTAGSGCDRKQSTSAQSSVVSAPATAPIVAVAASQPTTLPATGPATQPAYSYLVINDKLEEFPEARVRVLRSDDQVTVLVFTDDPKNAIDNDYQGNSFYLTMTLTDVKDTPGCLTGTWQFKSGTSDHEDTTEGIFLKGLQTHLQANDVFVRVEQIASGYQIRIVGQFFAFDTNKLSLPGVLTNVSGEVTATIPAKK